MLFLLPLLLIIITVVVLLQQLLLLLLLFSAGLTDTVLQHNSVYTIVLLFFKVM